MSDNFFRWAVVVTPILLFIMGALMQWQIYNLRKSREDEQKQNDELARLASSNKRLHGRVEQIDETLKGLPGRDIIEALKGDLKATNLGITNLSKNLADQSSSLERAAQDRERLVKLETDVAHFPNHVASHEDVDRVHNRVSDVRGEVRGIAKDVDSIGSSLAGVAATVESMNGNLDLLNRSELLQQGRKND